MSKLIISLVLLLVSTPVFAKNLYVDGSDAGCSDSTTYAENDADSPWCTFGRATWGSTDRGAPVSAQAAQAGDVVIVAPGTYTGPSSESKLDCTFTPANSGSAGAYITFRAETSAIYATVGQRTVLQTTGATSGGCVIGGNGKSYHRWIGFYVDLDAADPITDTGPVVVWGSSMVDVEENYITATTYPVADHADNLPGIRVETSDNVNLRNNYIANMRGTGDSHGAGIQGYSNQNVLVENNHIVNSNDGIYLKGQLVEDQENWTVRYNLVVDCDNGILIGGIQTASIYQNVIRDGTRGIRMLSYADPAPIGVDVYNNTIHNCSYGYFWHNDDGDLSSDTNNFYNNIFSDNGSAVYFEGDVSRMYSSADQVHFSYNFYFDNASFGTVNWDTWTGGTYGQDAGGTIGDDPLFVDEAGDDYRLDTGSPALTASLTSGPVGAYITGLECIGTGCTPAVAAVINFNQAGALLFNQTGTVNFNQ